MKTQKRSLTFYTVIFVICTGLMRLSGFLSKIIMAKAVTPYEYGIITLVVLSIPSMFQIFTDFFFFDLLSHSTEGRKYFGFSILYSTVVSLIIGVIIFLFRKEIFAFLNLPALGWEYIFIAFFMVILFSAYQIKIMGILRGYKHYSLSSLVSALPSFLRVFLLAYTIYALRVTDFNILLLVFAVPVLVVVIAISLKEYKQILKRVASIEVPSKDMRGFGFALFLMSMFYNVIPSIMGIIISHDLGIEMQAYFDVSLSLVAIVGISFGAMQFICVPEATGSKSKKDLLYKRGELGETVRGLFSVLIFCVIILFFYSRDLVHLLFSENYSSAADHVFILAIGYIFLFVQQFLSYMNVSNSKNLGEYKNVFLSAVILVLVLPFGIHFMILSYGFLGAYIAFTMSFVLYSAVTVFFSKDRSPVLALIFKWERLLATVLLTSAVIYFARLPLIIGLTVAGIVYACSVFAIGYLHKDMVLNLFRGERP